MRGYRPTVWGEWNPGQILLQPKRLENLAGLACKGHSECGETAPGCLLANYRNFSAMFAKVRRDCEQQGTGPCNYDAPTANGKTTLHHCLQAARTHDVGQRPAREWQKPFARSCRQHQLFVAEFYQIVTSFRQEDSCLRLVKDADSTELGSSGTTEAVGPMRRFALPLLVRLTSPDLPSEPRVVVNDSDTGSALGCADRGCHARRSATDYENVEALSHCHRIPLLNVFTHPS
jgi:hypothetical protein